MGSKLSFAASTVWPSQLDDALIVCRVGAPTRTWISAIFSALPCVPNSSNSITIL
jgi:hypothetical protein